MRIIRNFVRYLDKFGEYWSLIILPIILVPTIESVIMRTILNKPTMWGQELTTMLFGIYFMIGGAYCESKNGHIRMDVFASKYGPRGRILLGIATIICCTMLSYVIVIKSFPLFIKAFQTGERSESIWAPIIWPLRLSMPLGMFLMWVRSVISNIETINSSIQELKVRNSNINEKEGCLNEH